MKTNFLKTSVLALAIATSMLSITACGDSDSDSKDTAAVTYNEKVDTAKVFASMAKIHDGFKTEVDSSIVATEFAKIKNLIAADSRADISGWVDGYIAAEKSKVTAIAGTAGVYTYDKAGKPATRILNAKGVEYNQLIKKGLIGAYQFKQINAEIAKIGKQDNQVTLENVTGYLLGSYAELAKNARKEKTAGNQLKGYLTKYDDLNNDIYTALNFAEASKADQPMFEAYLNMALKAAQKLVATRAVYYFDKSGPKLESDFGGAAHGVSEGLGFVYSLQYTEHYTKAEVDAFISGLDLWNKPDAQAKILAKSNELKKKFAL